MEKRKHLLIAAGLNLLFYLIVFLKLDSIYYINDDLMIQDIMSGAFLGEVSNYTVYMNSVLSGGLAFFYKILPRVPWYGLFFYCCYYVCTTWILHRGLCLVSKKIEKVLVTILLFLIQGLLMLHFMILIHYTIIAAVLGATGIFLFVTNQSYEKPLQVLKKNSFVIVLLLLCFLTRSQVFFMLLPFLACAGYYKLVQGSKFWKELLKYLPLIFVMGVSVILFSVLDKFQYRNTEWTAYQEFNDARTSLYDYSGIPDYQEHQEFYQSIGIQEEQVTLIRSYNLLLDPTITSNQLQQIADYYNDYINQDKTILLRVKYAFFDYVKRMLLEQTDTPYQYMVFLLYGLILIQVIRTRRWLPFSSIILLGFMRSMIWIYLLYEKRFPIRISVSLYTFEILLLIAIFFMEFLTLEKSVVQTDKKRKLYMLLSMLILIFGIFMIPYLDKVRTSYQNQMDINREGEVLYQYMAQNEESFYLLDVYSVAKYSNHVFSHVNFDFKNYLLLGGWITDMPLVESKIQKYGSNQTVNLVLNNEHVFFVTDALRPNEYLVDYFSSIGKHVDFLEVDRIPYKSSEFIIYQIKEMP